MSANFNLAKIFNLNLSFSFVPNFYKKLEIKFNMLKNEGLIDQ